MSKANTNNLHKFDDSYDIRRKRQSVDEDPQAFDELEDEVIARESMRDNRPYVDPLHSNRDSQDVVDVDILSGLYQPEVNSEVEEMISDEEHYILQNSIYAKTHRIRFNRIVSTDTGTKGMNSNG